MKPSPENPTASCRFNSRRQLDLDQKMPENSTRNGTNEERTRNKENGASHGNQQTLKSYDNIEQRPNVAQSQHFSNISNLRQSNGAAITYQGSGQRLSANQATMSYETRRINNQLARAQFLAALPTPSNNNVNNNSSNNNQRQSAYFEKRFRARSESPQPSNARGVSRSPSAPTLETAL